jgi:hypothetical protein
MSLVVLVAAGLTLGLLGPWAGPAWAQEGGYCGDRFCSYSENYETCPMDCACIPVFQCSRLFSTCSFYKQKASGVCVYICNYVDTCVDTSLCYAEPTTTNGQQKFKIGPFPPDNCPFGDASFALTGTPE